MISIVGKKCCGCGACINICPKKCIAMISNDEGFLYPSVTESACVHCKKCIESCPVLSDVSYEERDNETWAVVSMDEKTVMSSSSGGCFSELANVIIEKGGCVFGATFSDNFKNIQHIMVERKEDLVRLRGSKYVQSEMGEVYAQVKAQLLANRQVLFSGTPCQVAGLEHFLGKEYDNLICVEVICHGTPSVKLWREYLDFIEDTIGGNVKYVNFRCKNSGWNQFGIDISNNNITHYYRPHKKDPFLRFFLKDLCLRESCYNCHFKRGNSGADITLGDYWGVEKVEPSIHHQFGVSLVLLHTMKGRQLFSTIKGHIKSQITDYNKAISYNSAYDSSVSRPIERDEFYKDLETMKWDDLVKKYLSEKKTVQIRNLFLSSLIGKLGKRLIRMYRRQNGGG